MKASGSRRERGAYYTPSWLAESLALWAIRSGDDSVIDPAAGRGELLVAASEQLRRMGGDPSERVFGVELHGPTARALRGRLSAVASPGHLLHADFFAAASRLPKCQVVVANPPYVRHQDIPAQVAQRMRATLDGRSDVVSGKASAWAYFLVYAPTLLNAHGRMAFVLPAEVLASDYAGPVIDHLTRFFKTIRFVYCDGLVFRDLSQQTVLCLADDYDDTGSSGGAVEWSRYRLRPASHVERVLRLGALSSKPLKTGATLMRLLAPVSVLRVERSLGARQDLNCLGGIASVGIGYVTGNNQFFHFSESQRIGWKLRPRHLSRVVTRARGVVGLSFATGDWEQRRDGGGACWLLTAVNSRDKAVRALLQRGRRARVHKGYKCRARQSWWRVPIGEVPAAFMTYMGATTSVVSNEAGVHVSNSLYALRELRRISGMQLAVASATSVFQLSAILNSRRLGGGLRKLEPSDASRILVPTGQVSAAVARRIDGLLRKGQSAEAREAADVAVLEGALGWSREAVAKVQHALSTIRKAAGDA